MNNTFIMTEENTQNVPNGISRFGIEANPMIMGTFSAAGGLRSTAYDMSLFAQYLLKVGIPDYGWMDVDVYDFGEDPNVRVHSGGSSGFSSAPVVSEENHRATFIKGFM